MSALSSASTNDNVGHSTKSASSAMKAAQQMNHPQSPEEGCHNENLLRESLQTMKLFKAIQNIDLDGLIDQDLTSVLPSLAHLLLNPSFVKRQQLLKLLYPYKKMNDVMNFMLLPHDATASANPTPNCPSWTFESSSPAEKLRMVATELMSIQDRMKKLDSVVSSAKLIKSELFDEETYIDEIFYCVFNLVVKAPACSTTNIADVCETLLHVKYGPTHVIRLVTNMPERCSEICQSLILHGERLDECATANDICEQRSRTLRIICAMNPSIATSVRSTTLQMCKMPSLTIMITLDILSEAVERYNLIKAKRQELDAKIEEHEPDGKRDSKALVKLKIEHTGLIDKEKLAYNCMKDSFDSVIAFMTGILLGVDESTRLWFAQYTKAVQQKRIDHNHDTVFSTLRKRLLECMKELLDVENLNINPSIWDPNAENGNTSMSADINSAEDVNRIFIRATATLRLYCTLRGIGSLKLNPEESSFLLRMILSCRFPANQTMVNFATVGVCTLLSCSALINNHKDEQAAAQWLKWLIKDSEYNYHKYTSHGKCSISELLLLIAIHFQNNQNSQIAELVCATLGMKLQIKASVSKCKSLFVQEVFDDQMIAEHAVQVPVTKRLDNNIKEFLPVHCIHQLLESRSFSKHQVPINDWIYRQICESKRPIHNIMPKLIEAYVNSIVISTSAHGHCGTNKPIEEANIARIFETKLYSIDKDIPKVADTTQNTNESATMASVETKKPERKRVKREPKASKDSKIALKSEPMDVDGEISSEVDQTANNPVDELPAIVDIEAAQVLMTFYLLLYEDVRLKRNADLSATERAELIKYSQDFMMDIPIFYLLQLVRDDQTSYATILPDMLKLVTTQYPHLCSIQHWMDLHHYVPKTVFSDTSLEQARHRSPDDVVKDLSSKLGATRASTSPGKSPNKPTKETQENLMNQLTEGFKNIDSDAQSLVKVIRKVYALPKSEIWSFAQFMINQLPKIVILAIEKNDDDYRMLVKVCARLWWKFNIVFPRKLWVMTVNAMRRPQCTRDSSNLAPVEYSWDELAIDPLIVLRSDVRVFRCVELLNILLHVLSSFLSASRRCLQDQISEQPVRMKETARNMEELKATLVLAQTSAAIQILLEYCLPTDAEQEALNKQENNVDLSGDEKDLLARFEASVDCICEHLHQVFIADTNLAKLVHFQAYPSELLATTSDKIPSMHICLDFIPELLGQPDLAKQIFVIELTSHLCEKYAITKSLNVAKLCFNVSYTLLQLLPNERRAHFFIPVLPALLRICGVFPILRDDAEVIINQLNQITLAHMAATSSRLSLGSSRPFEDVDHCNWNELKRLMNALSLQEALYMCIQKSISDLDKFKHQTSSDTSTLTTNNAIDYRQESANLIAS